MQYPIVIDLVDDSDDDEVQIISPPQRMADKKRGRGGDEENVDNRVERPAKQSLLNEKRLSEKKEAPRNKRGRNKSTPGHGRYTDAEKAALDLFLQRRRAWPIEIWYWRQVREAGELPAEVQYRSDHSLAMHFRQTEQHLKSQIPLRDLNKPLLESRPARKTRRTTNAEDMKQDERDNDDPEAVVEEMRTDSANIDSARPPTNAEDMEQDECGKNEDEAVVEQMRIDSANIDSARPLSKRMVPNGILQARKLEFSPAVPSKPAALPEQQLLFRALLAYEDIRKRIRRSEFLLEKLRGRASPGVSQKRELATLARYRKRLANEEAHWNKLKAQYHSQLETNMALFEGAMMEFGETQQ